MRRAHALVISLLLAAAVAVGTLAALKTTGLAAAGSNAPSVSAASIVKRRAALHRVETSLRRALDRRPPKLPDLPAYPQASLAGPATAPASAPVVTYVRPAPIVVTKHHSSEPDERFEHESEGDDD